MRRLFVIILIVLFLMPSTAFAAYRRSKGWGNTPFQTVAEGTQIDWSNPLAMGLGFAFVAGGGGGTPVDLVSGIPLPPHNAPVWSNTNAPLCNANNAGYTQYSAPVRLQPTKKVSILWEGVFTGNPTSNSLFFGCSNSNADNAPYLCYSLFVVSTSKVSFAYNDLNGFNSVDGTRAPNLNVREQYVATCDLSSGSQTLYINGIKNATKGTTGTLAYSASPPIGIGEAVQTINRTANHITYYAYVWPNVVLTESQVKSLWENPRVILQAPKTFFVQPSTQADKTLHHGFEL